MDLVYALEHRFSRSPDGAVWTETVFDYSFWEPYLGVFKSVYLVARARSVAAPPCNGLRVDGPGVTVEQVPFYVGPVQYAKYYLSLRRRLGEVLLRRADAALILRLPGAMGDLLWSLARRSSRPYGAVVVGDPQDVFAQGAIDHPLRPLFRWWFCRRLRQQCAAASVVAYVTKSALQQRYPAAPGVSAYNIVTEVRLPETAFTSVSRHPGLSRGPITVVGVGMLDQLYKGVDVLLEAVSQCVGQGDDIRVIWVGDGRYRPQMESRASSLGLADRVQFVGQLPGGQAVFAQLDKADLFVMPSRQEGLPRALIEAMARGLPCIGSAVGGIPELLSPEDIVPAGNAAALAGKIRDVISDPDRMIEMGRRNLETARQYEANIVRERRHRFLAHVRDVTHEWLIHGTGRSRL